MKVNVRNGDVVVREVKCWEHSRGIFSFDIFTPFDEFAWIVLGQEIERSRFCALLDVYARQRDEPARITITCEDALERMALKGIVTITPERWQVLVTAVPAGVYDQRRGLVASWKAPPARVDYLERLY